MKSKVFSLMFLAILVSLFVIGCGKKKADVKPVGELTQYKDMLYTFEVSYPKEWSKNCELGTARFYPDQNSITRFADPYSGAGQGGAQVKVACVKTDVTVEKFIKDFKDTMKAEQRKVEMEEKVKIGDQEWTKVTLTSNYGKDNVQKSFRIFLGSDSLITYIDCAAFNFDWEAYGPTFDAIVKTMVKGKLPSAGAATAMLEKPSDKFDNYSTPYFTVGYPENFNFSSPPKGKNEFSVELKGQRLDCTIRFDVFGAKGLTVEKVVNQNKAAYKATTATPATIDGNPAQYINYSQIKNVNSRAYFVVKNDKVIRITLNWYTPESDTYKPVFEKVVASMKLK